MDDWFDFTAHGSDKLEYFDELLNPGNYYLGNSDSFNELNTDDIYSRLCGALTSVSFGDYLCRFIHRKYLPGEQNAKAGLNEYINIIRSSFHETQTPYSWEETSEKETARLKRYLTQARIERRNVFLLGFGLRMDVEDVEELLTKGLKDRGINFKDPFEVICWFCLSKKYDFDRCSRFYARYLRYIENIPDTVDSLLDDRTVSYKHAFTIMKDEKELFAKLGELGLTAQPKVSKTACDEFEKLFTAAGEQISLFFDGSIRRGDITAGRVEDVLYSAIPKSRKGNRALGKLPECPDLIREFTNHLLTRQRIDSILNREISASRMDIITMSFLVHALKEENQSSEYAGKTRTMRYSEFINTVNAILEDCGMTPVLVSNPYECFILICILSDCPIDMFESIVEEVIKQVPVKQ